MIWFKLIAQMHYNSAHSADALTSILGIANMSDIYSWFLQEASLLSGHGVVVAFITIITILTVFGTISLFKVYGITRWQQAQLDFLEKELNYYNIPIKEAISKLSQNSLAYVQVQHLLRLAETTEQLNVRTASEVMPPRQFIQQQGYMAQFASNVLLIIGLAGTLWAFESILAHSQLIPERSSGGLFETSDFAKNIKQVHEGLESAMLASLTGIGGTVFLLFLRYFFVQPVQEKFFAHLDWVTETYLIPTIRREMNRGKNSAEQLLLETTTRLPTILGMIESITLQQKEHVEHSSSIVQKLDRFVENVHKLELQFEQSTGEDSNFYKVSERLAKATERMESSVDRMESSYNGVANQINSSINILIEQHKAIISQHQDVLEKIDVTIEKVAHSQQKLVEGITHIPSGFENIILCYSDTSRHINEIVSKSEELIKNLGKEHSTRMESMKGTTTAIENSIAKLEQFSDDFGGKAQELVSELTQLSVEPMLQKYIVELKDHWISMQSQFFEDIEEQRQTMEEALNQITPLTKIEHTVDKINLSIDEIKQTLTKRSTSWVDWLKKQRNT